MLTTAADGSAAPRGAVAGNGKAGPGHRHQRSSSDPFQQGSSELRERKPAPAVQAAAAPQTPRSQVSLTLFRQRSTSSFPPLHLLVLPQTACAYWQKRPI